MKKLNILLATTICALSSVNFAESARSNDVLQTIPGARNHTLIADASDTPTRQVIKTTRTTTKKTVKHKHRHTKKHHHPKHHKH